MSKHELALYLIREELKNRKFFNTLREAGIDDCFYQADLSTAILEVVGIDDKTDETYYYYSDLVDYCATKIKDIDSIKEQATKVYQALQKRGQ